LGGVTLCWLADDRHLVFSAVDWDRKGHRRLPQQDLWLLDTDNGSLRRLTNTPDAGEMTPAVSPDGNHIAFSRQAGPLTGHRRDIYTLAADGSQLHRVTNPRNARGLVNGYPKWSGDGKQILFWSSTHPYRIPSDGSAPAIAVMAE
jgi:Tol biopolymer transport system component